MLYFIDVTEQKNLEIQFAQSQKMQAVGQLAGGVAHDFNNLLTAMIGFCDLLLLRFRPATRPLPISCRSSRTPTAPPIWCASCWRSRGSRRLQPRVLDITDVLVELSHLLRRLIGENIELEVVHGRDLGLVRVDQGQLEQVIINLAVNARDAMPNGGQLTIRTANVRPARGAAARTRGHAGRGLRADRGGRHRGRDPRPTTDADLRAVFLDQGGRVGTGLGLSTVYGIVKQTGGFVFVDSDPGRDAEFRHLSAAPPGEPKPRRSVSTGSPNQPARRDLTGSGTVMLVEDDDPVRISAPAHCGTRATG